MEKVTGIGGFFFRAAAPQQLAAWYRDMLGIDLVPTTMDQKPWIAVGGATVFAPFAADTDYFAADKPFMLNLKVRDLDAMTAQLTAAGVEVTPQDAIPGIGRFAHITDPEGTPIELFEPEDQF